MSTFFNKIILQTVNVSKLVLTLIKSSRLMLGRKIFRAVGAGALDYGLGAL